MFFILNSELIIEKAKSMKVYAILNYESRIVSLR